MPRAAKTVNAVKGHRTKAEIALRSEGEKNLKTGAPLVEFSEVKKNKVAHKQFLRVKKLLESNDKNDDMYSAVVNRYCLLYSECLEFEKLKDSYSKAIQELSEDKEQIVDSFVDDDRETITLAQYYKMKNSFSKTITSLDSAIMSKRKMMFDIEKENLMTVASGLRSIPKTPPPAEESPILKALTADD